MSENRNNLTGYPSIDKPWLKYYSEEVINAPLPECTIYEYMVQNNKDYPSDIAIIYLGRKITYRELFENIDKTTAAFLKAGVKEKEIVTVALPSIPEAIYCVYALNKIGAVANMIHPLAGKEETLNYFNEVQSRIAVIFDGAYGALANDINKTSLEKVIVASVADSLPSALKIAYRLKEKQPALDEKVFASWKAFIQEGRGTIVTAVKKDCHEMAIISHTGGTTGEPKGVMCSDYNCNSLMWQLLFNFQFNRQETSLSVLPPFINYSLLESMMAMLAVGFKVVLLPKYDPLKFDDYIRKYHPNQVLSIPAYWEVMTKINKIERVDMSCFKHLYAGGEKMDPETEERINKLIKQCGSKTQLYNCMGSTEMTAGATIIYDNCYVPGSAGIPMIGINCKIVDPDTTDEVYYNSEGEICFSGPTLMLGYYNNHEATDDIVKIHQDGIRWLHTGDLGYIDEDGHIFVTGRIKRIVMTKGRDGQVTKLFPDRIERVISSCDSVEQCCVIGVPDEMRIHYPKAFVILKNNMDTERARKEITDSCIQNLPEYMIPVEIEFREDLPRTERGKVDYRALEKMGSDSVNEDQIMEQYLWTYDLKSEDIKDVINNWKDIIEREDGICKHGKRKDCNKEAHKKAFARQINLYKKIKKDEGSIETVKELIQLTSDEIETQYTRQGLIENRVGFLLALWGVAAVIVSENITEINNLQLGLASIVLGLISLILICLVIKGNKTSMYKFGSINNNFSSAVDDKAAFYVRLLEGITNAQIENNKIITKKYRCALWAVIFTAAYIIVLITMVCFWGM